MDDLAPGCGVLLPVAGSGRHVAGTPRRLRDGGGELRVRFVRQSAECDRNSVEAAIDGQGGPSSAEVYEAVSGALPNYCDLAPINPGCAVNCN